MANGFDLNSRVSRIKVTVAGFDQLDTLAVAVIFVRFFVYLIAAAFVHDYDVKLMYASAFIEMVVMVFTMIYTFKRDVLVSCIIRLLGQLLLAGAALGVIYVNGIITTYLTDVQKRESIIVLLVIFNVLFLIVETASTLFAIDVFLAASTARHRNSKSGEFKTRIRAKSQIIGTVLCIALLIIPAYISGIIISGLDNVKIDSRIYQIVQSEYVIYDHPATARKRNNGSVLVYDDAREVALADTPLYFGQDGTPDRIMMPKAYVIVEPSISSTKKVDTLSTIEAKGNGAYVVNSEDREREASNFFLYDGQDSYVFFDDITLSIGEKTVSISPYTYLKATYNGAIMIFDPNDAAISTFSLIGREAYAFLKDGTKLDIVTDILMKTDGSEQMLVVQLSKLEEYVG